MAMREEERLQRRLVDVVRHLLTTGNELLDCIEGLMIVGLLCRADQLTVQFAKLVGGSIPKVNRQIWGILDQHLPSMIGLCKTPPLPIERYRPQRLAMVGDWNGIVRQQK